MKQFFMSVIVMWLVATPALAITNAELPRDPRQQTVVIAKLIDEVFHDFSAADRLTIKRICDCESGGKNKRGGPNGLITHLDTRGQLVVNINSDRTVDRGAAQINRAQHSKHFWARHELNETEILDNLRYMRALIEDKLERNKRKFKDWDASAPCWDRNSRHVYNQ